MPIGCSSALCYPVPLKRRHISNIMQMHVGLNKLPPTLIIIIICSKWCLGTQRRAALLLLGCNPSRESPYRAPIRGKSLM